MPQWYKIHLKLPIFMLEVEQEATDLYINQCNTTVGVCS